MDPDSGPDPAIFVIDLQDASKKLIFNTILFCLLLFEGTFTSFSKIKSQKESQNRRNQFFSYYFCMMIEGSGSGSGSRAGSRAGSGSISGSGSGSGTLTETVHFLKLSNLSLIA
jgi:hypothetical protein